MQQQNENYQTQLDINNALSITQVAKQPQGKIRIPLKNRLFLGSILLLSSAILLLGQFTKTLAGIAFFVSFFLNIGSLFYALWLLRDRKQVSESTFIFWLGMALLVIGLSSMVGMILGLATHWQGL